MQIPINELYRVCPADSRALDTDDEMLFSEREAQAQAAARNLTKHDGCANWKAQRLSDAIEVYVRAINERGGDMG